jgi:5-bromo-4-chloroindolyl phosphate hydrolysis protein
VPSREEFKHASRYSPSQNNSKQKVLNINMLSGALILIVAIDYLITAFYALGKGESSYFLSCAIFLSMTISSLLLLRRGLALELIYNSSKYASAPRYPYKTIGAILLSSTTTFSAYLGDYTFISSFMLGASVFVGWFMYYGFDPRDDKIDGYDSDKSANRIMSLLVQANKDIVSIKEYAQKINSKSIATLMHEMAVEFEKIVQHIENEPDDYDRARKYLVSYLGELKSMCERFVKLDAKDKTEDIEDSFGETLSSSILKLKEQYEKLMDNDILDLDIKLSVMKNRFKNEE